ncbi:hypothetical protein LXG23DRAFT_38696 [Yarrowia lipolytica]|nr:hypothetical protein BKA91DRAFT_130511 [Yarrowia lipolytica]KAE8170055.1 hypothetical protein BKA90DRAFT_131010 [Yarrowia lipolytica]KAJ8052657.1 hypothetical protein LXG23DRAFT_38696 [Yarrowia lipolytica]RMJ01399.1 hypothetical protein BD777DRAFT_133230 [Yarrowia lipolytica]
MASQAKRCLRNRHFHQNNLWGPMSSQLSGRQNEAGEAKDEGRKHYRIADHDMTKGIRSDARDFVIWLITDFFLADDLLSSYLVFERRHNNIMEREPSSNLSWVNFMSRANNGHLIVRNIVIDKCNIDRISVSRNFVDNGNFKSHFQSQILLHPE